MNKIIKNILASLRKKKLKTILNSNKIIPIWSYIWITRRCNFSCPYCYVKNNQAQEMPFKEITAVIDKLKKMGCKMISFMGGEPTLRKDLVKIIKYVQNKNMFSYLTTNGSLLTQNYINKLIKAGLNFINLGVDSLKELNEQKYWKTKLIDNLLSKSNHFNLILNIAVSKKNIDQIPQILEICKNKNIIIALRLISKPRLSQELNYLSARDDKSLFFNKDIKADLDKVDNLADFLLKKKQQGYPLAGPEEYFRLMKDFIREKCYWPCFAGKFTLDINNDGKILLCSAFLKPFEIRFLDLNKNHYTLIQKEWKKRIKICNKTCLSPSEFCTTWYLNHPDEFLRNFPLFLK